MKTSSSLHSLLLIATISLLPGCGDAPEPANPADTTVPASTADAERIAALRTQLDDLKHQAQQVKDANDIKRLQRAYGYYVEEGLWDEVVNLFADNATLEIARDGVYVGKER